MGDSWFWLLPTACKQAGALPQVWGSLWLRSGLCTEHRGRATTQCQTTALESSAAAGFQSPGVEAILRLQVGRPRIAAGR